MPFANREDRLSYHKKYFAHRNSAGMCRCGLPLAVNSKWKCEKCLSQNQKRWKILKRDRSAIGLCVKCGVGVPKNQNIMCDQCLIKARSSATHYYQKLKREVIAIYGGVCTCCAESEIAFLTIDHINNDGAEHRRKIGKRIYCWLKQHEFPSDFQVLCFNCNCGKRINGGICPHTSSGSV
jgi:hypothetical protein